MGSYKSLLVFRCGSKKKSLERQKGNFAGDFADLIVFLDGKSWLGSGELWCVDEDFPILTICCSLKALLSEVRKDASLVNLREQIYLQQARRTIAIRDGGPAPRLA
jgi:hypothetical protein